MTNIKATNIELSDKLREHIEGKVAGLGKFTQFKPIERMYIEVGKSTNHHKQGEIFKTNFDVVIDGDNYHAFSETEDVYTSVDDAYDDLVRQVTERKDQAISIFRRGARSVKKMLKGISKRNPFTSKVE